MFAAGLPYTHPLPWGNILWGEDKRQAAEWAGTDWMKEEPGDVVEAGGNKQGWNRLLAGEKALDRNPGAASSDPS